MPADTHIEREFKFDIDPDFDPPDLRPVVGRTERLPEQHLTTTYLDTADRRLWSRGITLRHRLEAEGDDPAQGPGKWTLKLPEPARRGGGEGVTRSELSWTGSLDTVPPAALSIVAGVVRRARLEPVVVLSTERRRLLLHDDDQAWAEIDDDLATVTSGGREGYRFRQLEIELIGGDQPENEVSDGLGAVLSEFRRAGATPGGGSKLALAAGLDEDRRPAPSGRGEADVRSFVGGTLSVDLGLLLEADYRLRVPAGDGDPSDFDAAAVHATAAAIQRLRADLRVLGAVLDPVWVKHVRSDLKWAAGVLERLEDEDVLVGRVLSHADGGAVGAVDPDTVEELVRLLRSDRHLGATDLGEALASDRYTDMLDRLQAAVGDPPLFDVAGGGRPEGSLEAVLRSVVGAYWRVVKTELDQMGDRPGDEALEHLRTLARRLAHAAAMAEPYLGKKARKTASASSDLQAVLGRLRRSDHAARALAEIASHPAVTAPVAFVAGLVAGRAEHDAEHLRADWPTAAKKVLKAGKSAWSH